MSDSGPTGYRVVSCIRWTNKQLRDAKISKRKLTQLVNRLRKCSEQMAEMGLEIYGVNGSGNLIHQSRPTHKKRGPELEADLDSVVACVGLQGFNGGDW